MANRILKFLNSLVDLTVILALLLFGTYALYALWDNSRIYIAADHIQADMLRRKPDAEQEKDASFEQLRAINPDVCAWLTLEHTKIDCPVLQGNDNLHYLNTDVYGDFSLAGSIFLDARNDGSFCDAFSLLYGHHMENRRMFGDLDLYRDAEFFSENSAGMLILPDRTYRLEVFACLSVPASEQMIFAPQQTSIPDLLAFLSENALYLRTDALCVSGTSVQILGLSTCSSEFSDARTVVLALMESYLPEI